MEPQAGEWGEAVRGPGVTWARAASGSGEGQRSWRRDAEAAGADAAEAPLREGRGAGTATGTERQDGGQAGSADAGAATKQKWRPFPASPAGCAASFLPRPARCQHPAPETASSQAALPSLCSSGLFEMSSSGFPFLKEQSLLGKSPGLNYVFCKAFGVNFPDPAILGLMSSHGDV